MPWFKVDDGFHGHPKVVELSLEAVGVWTLAGSWCSSYLTDGEINLKSIRRIGGDIEHATELVAAGLWLDQGNSTYQFKDWADYQPLKTAIEAEREAARERMAAVRSKKKLRPALPPPPIDSSEDVRPNNTGTFARTSEEVRVTPSHPIPSQPSPPPYGGLAPRNEPGATGTKIPADFKVTPQMTSWALDNAPNVNVTASTRKFKAHYRSVSGPAQFKTDWTAAWEAWLLGDQERAAKEPHQFKTGAEKRMETTMQNAALFAQQDAVREITQ
ncbi:hypothetical protein SEA_ZUCKER_78 [Arthrobacter phage Zucker]|nr:hypothetical protein SEA_ZUCKER_78 [Arthrobacter phage Zucker]